MHILYALMVNLLVTRTGAVRNFPSLWESTLSLEFGGWLYPRMWRHFWNSVYGQYKEKHFDFCTDRSQKRRTMPLPNKALQWLCFLSTVNLREKSSLLAAWITSWKSGLQGPNPKANGGFSHYTVQYIFSSCWWVTAKKNIYLIT